MSDSEERGLVGVKDVEAVAAEEMDRNAVARVDMEHNRFPYAIVWGPLCPITCCFPCVGHMGIGDSKGRIHDFNGPYSIGVDHFMVGEVWRYFVVSGPEDRGWDAAIARADREYEGRMHNICCDNCHHHTALALTEGGRPHGLLSACLLVATKGKCTCW
uniref:Transmembrane protein 222 n=1 Tax=Calcidiscus leptoporus TaxID=127549 RepID=A0A7S0JIW0_9EUKA|mmetsp:Transcript_6620/g.15349  ORF Transcript_6620/g.15349 Transcript_6620/m.15349 type:complete len:159 (+) Transcript_6620:188-664(+)